MSPFARRTLPFLLAAFATMAPGATPGASQPPHARPGRQASRQYQQVIGVRVTRVVPLSSRPGNTPAPVLVEGRLEFSTDGPDVIPAQAVVHVGSFSTRTFPGSDRWSLIIAVDQLALPPIQVHQLGLNTVLVPHRMEGVLPEGWVSQQR